MSPNLYVLSDSRVLNMDDVRFVDKNAAASITVYWRDGTFATFADVGHAIFNKIVAASN